MLLVVAGSFGARRDSALTRLLYAGTQNLGSSACGSREHEVSAFVEFGKSFRDWAGGCAARLLDAGSPRRESLSLIAAAVNGGMAKRFLTHSSQAGATNSRRLRQATTTGLRLRRALLGSLGRLQREQADIFLLHSPIAADLADGESSDCLGKAIEAPFCPNRQDLT